MFDKIFRRQSKSKDENDVERQKKEEEQKNDGGILVREYSGSNAAIEEAEDSMSDGSNLEDPKRPRGESKPEDVYEEDKRQKYMISKEEFVVDVRYKPIKKLGSGAYGMVCSATDSKQNNKKLAIKKVRDTFHNLTDAKRILREMKLLQHLVHPNIIKLEDIINPLTREDFEDLYMVFEYMQSDLHRIIYSDNELSEDHIAYIIYQILCGLKYIHSAKVIHRDLKPGNILINADCQVKICDMGLARGTKAAEDEEVDLTEYVVTRWYRAPEVMVSAQNYDTGIDVWAVGCIMAEMLNREPLFQGENYVDQLNVIFSVIGTPADEDMSCVLNPEAMNFIKKLKKRAAVPVKKLFPTASAKAQDFLSKIFVFNPANRITVDQALEHPFLKKFYNDEFIKKCVCDEDFDFEFEKLTRTKENIQDLMFQEIVNFRPHALKTNPLQKKKRSTHRRSITSS
jgi:mitogen-activated protein kinase 1/3